MKFIGTIAGVFAVLGAVALPASANTLPVRVAPTGIKADMSAQVQSEAQAEVLAEESPIMEETAPVITEEVQTETVVTEEVSPTEESSDSLEAIRRNNIKQKLEALYGDNETSTQTEVKTETARKETGIKGFFKSIIKLFE